MFSCSAFYRLPNYHGPFKRLSEKTSSGPFPRCPDVTMQRRTVISWI